MNFWLLIVNLTICKVKNNAQKKFTMKGYKCNKHINIKGKPGEVK